MSPYKAEGLVFDTEYTVSVVSVGNHDRSEPSKPVKFKTSKFSTANIRKGDAEKKGDKPLF